MSKRDKQFEILIVDCCEHTIKNINKVPFINLITMSSRSNVNGLLRNQKVDLIVIGVSRFPVRKFFLNRLRRFFPDIPLLILRREPSGENAVQELLRGDFFISDHFDSRGLEVIEEVSKLFPMKACEHVQKSSNYDLVHETLRVIKENYADPELSLMEVAKKLLTSPSKLSRTLNQQLGISFRKLLKQVRIEESKTMLASHKFSVKEVAARTGFSDSHYFSRSFKEVTGVNATEYQYTPRDMLLR